MGGAVGSLVGVDALITGAGRGLGLGVAHVYAEAGARVWIVAEDADELALAESELESVGADVESRVVDLAVAGQRDELTHELADNDRLRVIVNNAGVLERRPVAELDPEHWERTLAVNLTAPAMLTRGLLPGLVKTGGSIINVSSRAGLLAFPLQAAYGASKFGLEAFTRCLAIELMGTRVSVNTVTPGLRMKPTSVTRAEARQIDPTERSSWHDPRELAPAFLFLASLRGEARGFRFDALALTGALKALGWEQTLKEIRTVAEYVPPEFEGVR